MSAVFAASTTTRPALGALLVAAVFAVNLLFAVAARREARRRGFRTDSFFVGGLIIGPVAWLAARRADDYLAPGEESTGPLMLESVTGGPAFEPDTETVTVTVDDQATVAAADAPLEAPSWQPSADPAPSFDTPSFERPPAPAFDTPGFEQAPPALDTATFDAPAQPRVDAPAGTHDQPPAVPGSDDTLQFTAWGTAADDGPRSIGVDDIVEEVKQPRRERRSARDASPNNTTKAKGRDKARGKDKAKKKGGGLFGRRTKTTPAAAAAPPVAPPPIVVDEPAAGMEVADAVVPDHVTWGPCPVCSRPSYADHYGLCALSDCAMPWPADHQPKAESTKRSGGSLLSRRGR